VSVWPSDRRAAAPGTFVGTAPALRPLVPNAPYPKCAICAETLLPSEDPVLDDGACYHRRCMDRSAFGAGLTPGRSDVGKCAHCSKRLSGATLGVMVDGDELHEQCWLMLLSAERVRLGRGLSRQTRDLIARARSVLDRPPPQGG
jgi:hypothetical protein